MHAQAMREMAENGVLFDGVESNGGVMASQWYTTTNFHKLCPMVKTASLHLFWELPSLLFIYLFIYLFALMIV